MYEVSFADRALYARERFDCMESNLVGFTCVWRSLAEFRAGTTLYPEGLMRLLD